MKRALIAVGILAAVLGLFYLPFVHHTDPHQVAIARNLFTGRLELDSVAGFNLTAPWVKVVRIDTRPARVCITSATRGFNCKLVQFVPSAYRQFVAVQGFRYYWLANRISFNSGYDEEYRGMRDILRGYAFSAQQYPFVRVLEEYSTPDNAAPPKAP